MSTGVVLNVDEFAPDETAAAVFPALPAGVGQPGAVALTVLEWVMSLLVCHRCRDVTLDDDQCRCGVDPR